MLQVLHILFNHALGAQEVILYIIQIVILKFGEDRTVTVIHVDCINFGLIQDYSLQNYRFINIC